LFVVLDPFWFTQKQRGMIGNWKRTLGAEQHQWLKHTLEASRANFKFVFIHHLVGGIDDQNRGGSEAASFFEWGGKNADGNDGFSQNRTGWPAPIHQLLVQNRVSTVFHGHDHLYAKQDLDGIVCHEVPQPGDPRGNTRSTAEYGYKSGTILGSSGHMRIMVSPNKVSADYVYTTVFQDKNVNRTNRQVLHSNSIPDIRKVESPTGSRGQNSDNLQQNEGRIHQAKKPKLPHDSQTIKAILPDVEVLTRLSLVLGRPTDKSVTVGEGTTFTVLLPLWSPGST
jgi:hypothetical protein